MDNHNKFANADNSKKQGITLNKITSSYYCTPINGLISFGTSGHRGTSLNGTFNDLHVACISQAICNYRRSHNINGPLFLGFDTHALSEPAFQTALEVFAANHIDVIMHHNFEYTPTPVISYLILEHNRNNPHSKADGVILTPSHNPPEDGGYKYNSPHGGPADVDITNAIQTEANHLLNSDNPDIKRILFSKALNSATTQKKDFILPYIKSLSEVINTDVIRDAGVKIGIDAMSGAGANFWQPMAEYYKFNFKIVNAEIDKSFKFMPLDHDGIIRMDCSSPYAMAHLINLSDDFDIAWGNDPDCDRHGIVTKHGLMNPNHYLSVAIWYLIQNRNQWSDKLKIGKTLVSSNMIDKIANNFSRQLIEVPVGFKWFVQGLFEGSIAFCGEESAGASFLRKNGHVWTTDKDGFVLSLLSAEILAKTGRTPSDIYNDILIPNFGETYYQRIDGPITEKDKSILSTISYESFKENKIAGLHINNIYTTAPGNNAPIGGIKVSLSDGSWFAIRPSGTEPKMKLYIECNGGPALSENIKNDAFSLIFG